jgi:hypothetical protein
LALELLRPFVTISKLLTYRVKDNVGHPFLESSHFVGEFAKAPH